MKYYIYEILADAIINKAMLNRDREMKYIIADFFNDMGSTHDDINIDTFLDCEVDFCNELNIAIEHTLIDRLSEVLDIDKIDIALVSNSFFGDCYVVEETWDEILRDFKQAVVSVYHHMLYECGWCEVVSMFRSTLDAAF